MKAGLFACAGGLWVFLHTAEAGVSEKVEQDKLTAPTGTSPFVFVVVVETKTGRPMWSSALELI